MRILQWRLSWRRARYLAAGIVTLSVVALLTDGVGAVLPQGQVAVATAGADASYQAMLGVLPNSANHYNIPALPTSPYHVEGDAHCGDLDYVTSNPGSGQAVAPSGATAALDVLKSMETSGPNGAPSGCIDIARSSSPPRGTAKDGPNFEYYAFALDAVSWASPATSKIPVAMTLQTLQQIYNCTITDWGQVPNSKAAGPIQRYFTQVGSGTGSFFQSDLLGGQDPMAVSNPPSCPAPKRILQSEGVQIDPADTDKAILPYSVGAWIYQTNNEVNPTINVSNGVQLGGLVVNNAPSSAATFNTADGVWQDDTAGVVNENNVKLNNASPAYPGIRYLYNVVDRILPSYDDAWSLIGFDNVGGGQKSPLCGGQRVSPLLSYGLGPLSSTGNPNNHNLAGATCRRYTNS